MRLDQRETSGFESRTEICVEAGAMLIGFSPRLNQRPIKAVTVHD